MSLTITELEVLKPGDRITDSDRYEWVCLAGLRDTGDDCCAVFHVVGSATFLVFVEYVDGKPYFHNIHGASYHALNHCRAFMKQIREEKAKTP